MVWNRLMEWLHIAVLFILLNVLWIAGCLLGLGIFGLIPSTVALMQILNDKRFLRSSQSYLEVVAYFIKGFKATFLHHKLLVVVPPIFLILFIMEWLMIRGIDILRAAFMFPTTFIILYLIVMILNISYLMTVEKKVDLSYLKLILLSPLVFAKVSAMIILCLLTFGIISLAKPFLALAAIPVCLYTAQRMLKMDYAKKGWGALD